MRLKRLEAPAWWNIERKTKRFVISPRGPHPLDSSLPLGIVIRDILKLSDTAREAKSVMKHANVSVDGKVCRDYKFGIGVMDIIEIAGKAYRVVLKKTGLKLIEITKKEASTKLCKIINKTTLNKGKVQLNLHDGKNIIVPKDTYKTNDSLLLEIPKLKILEHLKFEPESLVFVTSGKNQGKIAKLKKIEIIRSTQPNRVWIENSTGVFEAPFDSVMVVGKEKPIIELGEKLE